MNTITTIGKKKIELINNCCYRIDNMGTSLLEEAINAGQHLTEAKLALPHGSWMEWVKSNIKCSHKSATNYMRLYEMEQSDELEMVANIGDAYKLMISPPKIGKSAAPPPPAPLPASSVTLEAEIIEQEPSPAPSAQEPLVIETPSTPELHHDELPTIEAPEYDEAAIRLADEFGVTPAEVVKAGQFAEAVETLGLNEAVRSGKSSYDIILGLLPHLTKEEIKSLIETLNTRWT